MRAPRLHITPQGLHSAWLARRRPHWPDTFAAAMAHPMLRRVVRAEAVRLALAALRANTAVATAHTTTAPPPSRTAPRRTAPLPALLDRKRLAAGDVD